MPVTLLCPNLRCRAVLQVPDIARGRSVRCGRCGLSFLVPKKSAIAQEEAAGEDGAEVAGQKGKKKK